MKEPDKTKTEDAAENPAAAGEEWDLPERNPFGKELAKSGGILLAAAAVTAVILSIFSDRSGLLPVSLLWIGPLTLNFVNVLRDYLRSGKIGILRQDLIRTKDNPFRPEMIRRGLVLIAVTGATIGLLMIVDEPLGTAFGSSLWMLPTIIYFVHTVRQYILFGKYKKQSGNRRLKMEVELLRDFLSLTGKG